MQTLGGGGGCELKNQAYVSFKLIRKSFKLNQRKLRKFKPLSNGTLARYGRTAELRNYMHTCSPARYKLKLRGEGVERLLVLWCSQFDFTVLKSLYGSSSCISVTSATCSDRSARECEHSQDAAWKPFVGFTWSSRGLHLVAQDAYKQTPCLKSNPGW